MRCHLHHGMPCAARRHNTLAKYSKEAFMKAFTDALTNQSINLGSSSRRVSSCRSNSNNSNNSKSFRCKNTVTTYVYQAPYLLFPPCSTALIAKLCPSHPIITHSHCCSIAKHAARNTGTAGHLLFLVWKQQAWYPHPGCCTVPMKVSFA